EEILTYSAGRHRGDLIELIAQSVDHKTLCLSFFTRPLLGIPQRLVRVFSFLPTTPHPCIANIATRLKDEALRSINDCSAVNQEDDNCSPFEA
ncbi:hypothetical protein, partial [Klebsiella michiganensis]|uniref:hypothetical protein n=1 Tax=Klebsiella michiganensis TaxID=1134687 RepID=UPI001C815E51